MPPMTAEFALNFVLALLVLPVALWTIVARSDFAAVFGFVAYGLLLTIVWVRLNAFDVALIEGAIGSGLTGALMLRAVTPNPAPAAPQTSQATRAIAAIFCAAISAGLAAVVLSLPQEAPTLAPLAVANAGATGLRNPVTNVLMAYRAVDTLLEKIVLLLALAGAWSLAHDANWRGRVEFAFRSAPQPLVFLARILPPVGIVAGVYILWTSADHPGGAFQGGTVLATMWLLTIWAGLTKAPRPQSRVLRLGLIAGPVIFLGIGFAAIPLGGPFLSYPLDFAKPLILAIEFAMTLTIAVTLALLMAGPPKRRRL